MTRSDSPTLFERAPVIPALLGGMLLGILLLVLELRVIALKPMEWEATSLLELFAVGAPWYIGSHLALALVVISTIALVRKRLRGSSQRRLEPASTVVWTLTWLLFIDLFFIFSAEVIEGGWRAPIYLHGIRVLAILAIVSLVTLIPVAVLGRRIRATRWRVLAQLSWGCVIAFTSASWLQHNQTWLSEGAPLLRPGLLLEVGTLLVKGFVLVGVALLIILAATSVARRSSTLQRWGSPFLLAILYLVTLILTVTLWIGSQHTASPTPQPEAASRPASAAVNVVEIVVDTLGAKYLAPEQLEELPAFRRLAKDSIQFTRTYATGSLTSASVPGIFTGRLDFLRSQPNAKKLRYLHDEEVTTAEVLKDLGYQTVGFSANPVVSAVFNFDQGFDYFSSENETSLFWFYFLRALGTVGRRALYESGVITGGIYYTDAETLYAKAERYLRAEVHRPFYLFLQIMDPHGPYLPDRKYLEDDFSFDDFITYSDLLRRVAQRTTLEVPPKQRKNAFQRYKGELRYTDHYLSKLLDLLHELDLYDDTLLIVTADHGEEWWEHGSALHGHSVYDELIHVPLMVKFPSTWECGEARSSLRRIHVHPVSTLDILPTIVDTVADGALAKSLNSRLEGGSLGPVVCRQEGIGDRVIQGASMGLSFVIQGDWKLTYSERDQQYELYDLRHDPEEKTNLFATDIQKADDLRVYLDSFLAELQAGQKPDQDLPELPADVRKRLRTLGYVD